MSEEKKIEPAKLPEAVGKKYTLHVPQPKHFIPSLNRVVDVTKLKMDEAKIIADKHPALLTAKPGTQAETKAETKGK